jgi:exopolysaccharide biosynthesis polyprenyl glycosylphosphotransferase
MIRLRHKLLVHLFRLFDQCVMLGAAAVLFCLRPAAEGGAPAGICDATFSITEIASLLIILLGWIWIFHQCIRYNDDRLVPLRTQLVNVFRASALATAWLMLAGLLFPAVATGFTRGLVFLAVVAAVLAASRLCLRFLLLVARSSGRNQRYLLVVGANGRARDIIARIEQKPELGYTVAGFVAETPRAAEEWSGMPRKWPLLGTLDGLCGILCRERVDEIAVCLPVEARFSEIARIVRSARDLGIVVRLIPEFANGSMFRNLHVEEFENECVVTLFRERLLMQLLFKRMVDASVALAAIVAISPLMLLVAALVKLTSRGPVFFVQNRVGMNQRLFKLYKFRSMVADAECRKKELLDLNERDGPVFKIGNDPRITPVGRFLRKTSIDELPQLYNVLVGEMSLVGPRPPLPEEVRQYHWLFRKRLCVKPGLTCIWQISGRNDVSFERWMRMDHEYIDNWSFWLDLRILLKTIPAVVSSRGAS